MLACVLYLTYLVNIKFLFYFHSYLVSFTCFEINVFFVLLIANEATELRSEVASAAELQRRAM